MITKRPLNRPHKPSLRLFAFIILIATSILAIPATAQNRKVPYWASLRFETVNLRVGPSGDYRIDWVYKRRGLPVTVIRVVENWRLVRDQDGTQGWIAQSQLHPDRTAVVIGEGVVAMRDAPTENGQLKWNAQPGVVGKLGDCQPDWCELDVGGRAGWVMAARLWGTGKP